MMTLQGAIDLAHSTIWAHLKPYTQTLYYGRAVTCASILGLARPVQKVDRNDLAKIVAELIENEHSHSTVRSYVQAFVLVLKEAERHGKRGPIDTKGIMPKGEARKFRVVTADEERQIIEHIAKMVRSPIRARKMQLWTEFTILTGLRLSETVGGRGTSDAVQAARPIHLVYVDLPDGSRRRCLEIRGKGRGKGKDRLVPLTARANEILDECMAMNETMHHPKAEFFHPLKRDRCESVLRQCWYELALGGKPITPHVLRHTFGTRNALTANIYALQASMGHAQITTTQQYVHLNPASIVLGMDLRSPQPTP